MTRHFEKTNLRNKEALNKLKSNDDSPEEKIFSKNSGSEASDTIFIDTKNSKKRKRGMKEKWDIQREDIFEKAKYVTITSESACSSNLSYYRSFQPHYRIFSRSGGYKEMVTAYFRALCKLEFEDDSFL